MPIFQKWKHQTNKQTNTWKHKTARISQTTIQQQQEVEKVMGKDKTKEAEQQRRIQFKRKELTKLKAFWAYAEKKNPAFLNEFLASYEGEQSSSNHEAPTKHQETPRKQLLGGTLVNDNGCNNPNLDFLNDPNCYN